ncbi:hypothetical protein C7999DRAFT_15582 [Corynascus novoguineensis]|uniref:Uncharacterized protein n=1 Tax=Corynascus novoguineensis TaxID=1126955 RepID=A0AAN7CQ97_9PEZI|nr:hypothetical protein C7999DRAFT_15582 [Corynascus novoguineensis]
MKAPIVWSLAALVVTVHAYCDGEPDATWRHNGDCSYPNDSSCMQRCVRAGWVCGGCGGFMYGECWCCNNDCAS